MHNLRRRAGDVHSLGDAVSGELGSSLPQSCNQERAFAAANLARVLRRRGFELKCAFLRARGRRARLPNEMKDGDAKHSSKLGNVAAVAFFSAGLCSFFAAAAAAVSFFEIRRNFLCLEKLLYTK